MKNSLLIGVTAAVALLSGCFGEGVNPAGGGGQGNGGNASSKLTFTSSSNQVVQGDSVLLTWQGEAVDNCQAGGAWTGAKPISGSESIQLFGLGSQTFSLVCSAANSSDTLTRDTTVSVISAGGGPKSGVDGDDADALYQHFNQYAQ